MEERQRRPRIARAAVAALLIVLVAASPTLLLGEPLTPFGLLLMAVAVLGLGLFLRLAARGEGRTLGSILLVFGVILLAIGVGVTAMALGGWGRPY